MAVVKSPRSSRPSAYLNPSPLQRKRQLKPLPPAGSSWFAADPSKAYYEKVSLVWAPLSMFFLLAGVLGTDLYKYCDRNSYLAITVIGCLPGVIVPIFFPCHADRGKPYSERFWVKASVWVAIFGFYGNYFWTHYFYQLLDAKYLFDAYWFNDVPIVCFVATFFYFSFYFSLINVILRRVSASIRHLPSVLRAVCWWASIFALAYLTAVFEAVSIQHYPLYTYRDKDAFILVGSIVYGIYFIIGFPMFFSLDEEYRSDADSETSKTTVWAAAVNSFAAAAIVTLLLDFWRLSLGSIYDLGANVNLKVPFVYQGNPDAVAAP